ncbi:MAG: acetyl-CoA carboxylase biotin carboxyl carrier protein subunit [Candidatus Marinimicrobia bacterium]|nr:acetyl-CoA carboxylase biotin carboxyl carrier protein subunit [Candidatus Neomarinimicrobiota bacterium]
MKEKKVELEINGKPFTVVINEITAYRASVTVNDRTYEVGLKDLGIDQVSDIKPKLINIPESPTATVKSSRVAPPAQLHRPKSVLDSSAVVAPLPGLIQNILVKVGENVRAGQHVLTMEAMKMENEIQTNRDGIIKDIRVKIGDSVNEGDTLIILE